MEEMTIKQRSIRIDRKNCRNKGNEIENSLLNAEGLLSVVYGKQKGLIRIKYDLQRINFETIEKLINQLDIKLSAKWVDKLKRGMVRFTEQNELDNLKAAVSSCCSDPRGKKE